MPRGIIFHLLHKDRKGAALVTSLSLAQDSSVRAPKIGFSHWHFGDSSVCDTILVAPMFVVSTQPCQHLQIDPMCSALGCNRDQSTKADWKSGSTAALQIGNFGRRVQEPTTCFYSGLTRSPACMRQMKTTGEGDVREATHREKDAWWTASPLYQSPHWERMTAR